ncbi:MAG TPA: guanosine monophosphate reductase, partial [Methylomirabilota bacterium]|nr:guanosine monophosphate reductase [Methylomirabilota bacterium]
MSKVFYKALGQTETWPNLTGIYPSSLTYDDVYLVPQNSPIASRADVEVKVTVGPYTLTKPIIAAPMDTITGEKMIRELARLGALGSLPRGDLAKRVKLCKQFSKENIPCLYAVGLKNGMDEAAQLIKAGAKLLVIDVAHGGSIPAQELAHEIKKKYKNIFVMAGNIVTSVEGESYKKYSIDIAKVGVGPGGMCTTRIVAGNGFPQLSAIFEVTATGLPVIADGGIKQPGDVAKAIAAGATCVIIGSLFAGTDETPGDYTGSGMKIVRGQASSEYMDDQGIVTNEFRAAEGVSIEVPAHGPVEQVIKRLMGGLRSAM